MKLDCVQIKNFKSIKDIELNFDPACRVLVGINESGKSNILSALALLGDDESVKKNCQRDPTEAKKITESHVRFIFNLEKEDSDELLESVLKKILTCIKNPSITLEGAKNYTIRDFCQLYKRSLYVVDILGERKYPNVFSISGSHKLVDGWKKPSSACPQNYPIDIDGKRYYLHPSTIIRAEDFANIPEAYLEDASYEDFSSIVINSLKDITKTRRPEVLFWRYEDKNLLPSKIKIDDFVNNPDCCPPLKNMFALAGFEDDVGVGIKNAREGSSNGFQNFLDRIARRSTEHFKKVWKEHQNVKFALVHHGDEITPGIIEKNTHDFSKRSDGFKKFITFLLMISVDVQTNNLCNTLLLIDEPDHGLHPSGVRYLRDELIKISKKNYVVYSTHSIFMIDSNDISRHYIVTKKNEETSIESAGASNIVDEEVLYMALGYSITEIIKKKNIIFEGWKDKELFKIGLHKIDADKRKKWEEMGVCHASGVKDISRVASLLELAKRECLIVSDSDKVALDRQKEHKKSKNYGEWAAYQDIDQSVEAITGEDFLANGFIAKQVQCAVQHLKLPAFDASCLPPQEGKIEAIKKWLEKHGVYDTKKIIKEIKDALFESLKPEHIEDKYLKVLEGIENFF